MYYLYKYEFIIFCSKVLTVSNWKTFITFSYFVFNFFRKSILWRFSPNMVFMYFKWKHFFQRYNLTQKMNKIEVKYFKYDVINKLFIYVYSLQVLSCLFCFLCSHIFLLLEQVLSYLSENPLMYCCKYILFLYSQYQ